MFNCLDCAKKDRQIQNLQAEVIRLGQMWLELKKFIISKEKGFADNEYGQTQKP